MPEDDRPLVRDRYRFDYKRAKVNRFAKGERMAKTRGAVEVDRIAKKMSAVSKGENQAIVAGALAFLLADLMTQANKGARQPKQPSIPPADYERELLWLLDDLSSRVIDILDGKG